MNVKVLVTGAKGFLASHVIHQLIELGYFVVGTVRTKEKGEFYINKYGNQSFNYSIVREGCLEEGIRDLFQNHPDIKYVIHTASPLFYNGKDPERDVIQPSVNNMLMVLNNFKTYGTQLKKVVITSSMACMLQDPPRLEDPTMVYNETMWNPITLKRATQSMQNAYFASKVYAEKSVWKFVKSANPHFKVTTIQLPLIIGPSINDLSYELLHTSNEFWLRLITRPQWITLDDDAASVCVSSPNISPTSPLPSDHDNHHSAFSQNDSYQNNSNNNVQYKLPYTFPFYIDVRDAAATHVRAMLEPGLDNKRCLSVGGVADSRRLVEALLKVCPEYEDHMSPDIVHAMKTIQQHPSSSFAKCDTSECQKYLHIDYMPLEKSLYDTVNRIRELERLRQNFPSP